MIIPITDTKIEHVTVMDIYNIIKSDKIKVICGPIIGSTTSNSLRVLYEFNKDIENLEISAKCSCGCTVIASKKNIKACRPSVFTFSNLKCDAKYDIWISDTRVCEESRKTRRGCVKTLAKKPEKFDVVVISGNKIEDINKLTDEYDNLWLQLYNKLKTIDIDCIFHIGGQVFLENAIKMVSNLKFPELVNKKDSLTSEDKIQIVKLIKDNFRDIYRVTWNCPYVRQVLASCQNLMMLNKDDIYESYNTTQYRKIIKEVIGFDIDITKLAIQVYREYQRHLWDNKFEDNEECYAHIWGKYGVFFIDELSNKTISDIQYKYIDEFLKIKELEVVYLCTQTQLTPASKNLSHIFNIAQEWKKPTNNIIFISPGGPGIKTTLTNIDTKTIINSITCGPIAKKLTDLIEPEKNIVHGKWVIDNQIITGKNYGCINVTTINNHNITEIKLHTSLKQTLYDDPLKNMMKELENMEKDKNFEEGFDDDEFKDKDDEKDDFEDELDNEEEDDDFEEIKLDERTSKVPDDDTSNEMLVNLETPSVSKYILKKK